MLRKMFLERLPQQWKIVEKDLVDEIIFRTMKPRNRIMLELMARGGMRVCEVGVEQRKSKTTDPREAPR